MKLREELLQLLPPYLGNKKKVVEEQSTSDIIKYILSSHKMFVNDYDKISSLFWQGNQYSTAEYIFNFLKNNVRYSVEPEAHQSVRSPAAIIATGIYADGGNDCKHYAGFIGGVLDSLKRKGYPVNWKYRFANYKLLTSDPGHVFVVINDGKKETWVDPVLPTFNNRKQYINAIDKKVNTMALYVMSGTGNNNTPTMTGSNFVSDDSMWMAASQSKNVGRPFPPGVSPQEFVYRYLVSTNKNCPGNCVQAVKNRLKNNNMLRRQDLNAKRVSDFALKMNGSIGSLLSDANIATEALSIAAPVVDFISNAFKKGAERDAWTASGARAIPMTQQQEQIYRTWLGQHAYTDAPTYKNVMGRLFAAGNLRLADMTAQNAQQIGTNGLISPLLSMGQMITVKPYIDTLHTPDFSANNQKVNDAISAGIKGQPLGITQPQTQPQQPVQVQQVTQQPVYNQPAPVYYNNSVTPVPVDSAGVAPVAPPVSSLNNMLPWLAVAAALILITKK